MALTVLCSSIIPDPHVVALVSKEELEWFIVLVLDPRGSVLLIRMLYQNRPFVLNIWIGMNLKGGENVAVGGCHFMI